MATKRKYSSNDIFGAIDNVVQNKPKQQTTSSKQTNDIFSSIDNVVAKIDEEEERKKSSSSIIDTSQFRNNTIDSKQLSQELGTLNNNRAIDPFKPKLNTLENKTPFNNMVNSLGSGATGVLDASTFGLRESGTLNAELPEEDRLQKEYAKSYWVGERVGEMTNPIGLALNTVPVGKGLSLGKTMLATGGLNSAQGGLESGARSLVRGDDKETVIKNTLGGAVGGFVGGAAFGGIGKGLSKLSKPINVAEYTPKSIPKSEFIGLRKQLPSADRLQLPSPAIQQGPITIKPKTFNVTKSTNKLDNVLKEYDDAVGTIQNYFKTNELRTNEVNRIKSELGIDIDDITKRLLKAETTTTREALEKTKAIAQLKKMYGLQDSKVSKTFDKFSMENKARNNLMQQPKLPIKNKLEVNPQFRKEFPFTVVKGKELPNAKLNSTPRPIKQTTQPINNSIGNANTFRNKISRDIPKKKSSLKDGLLNLRSSLEDDVIHFADLEKKVRGKVASAENSLYKQARLYKGVPERANSIIETELKPIIKRVEDKGYNYKDLEDYAEAIHARDVNNSGMNSGFTSSEIDDVIRKFGTQEMEKARIELVNYSNRRLDDLVNVGNISKESVDAMRIKWKNYMPLNRSFDDDSVEFSQGLGKNFANVATPIKKLKGSDKKVISPIESMIKNTYLTEDAVGRAKVSKQIANLADDDVDEKFIRKLADGEEVGRKNVINVKENGVNVKYEVPPEIFKTMSGMNKEVSNMFIQILSKPADILRAGATLTPEFPIRNAFRDLFQAWQVNKSGFNPITDFASGFAAAIGKNDLYNDFLKSNGGYGNIISMDRQAHKNVLEEIIKQPISKKFVNIIHPKSWLAALRRISDITESATKIGVYKSGLRKGFSKEEAAFQARDIMDFARAGSSVRPANRVIAFLNASIQGKSKLIRAIAENPLRVSSKIAVSMALPSIGIFILTQNLANDKQKATINDAPNWLKDTFWLIPIPNTDIVARMPKPFDTSVVSNVLEKFMDYAIKNEKDAFEGFIKRTISESSIPSMLTGLTPIVEGMADYSFFRDSPIIPTREKNLMMKDQFDINTSETSKGIASLVRKATNEEGTFKNFGSPRIIENTIKDTTAGLGGYALSAIDYILGETGTTEKKILPTKNISQQPLIKAFLVNDTASGKSMDFLYTQKNKLTNERNSFKLDNPTPKATGKLMPKSEFERIKAKSTYQNQERLDYLSDVTEEIGKISKEIRQATNSKELTPKEKQDIINKLSEERNNLSRLAYTNYKSKNLTNIIKKR